MNLGESLTVAIRALSANKVRTTLTMLGVIIGVAAVILLVAIGSGVQDEVTGTIEGLGSNLVFVLPGNMEEGSGGPAAVSITMFSMEDADFLRRRLGPENLVVPIVQAPVTLRVGNRSMRSAVAAANEHAGEVFASDFEGGRDYRRSEVTAGSRVVVLGSSVRDELFPFQDPVGREIDINGQRFTVIGHLAAQGGTLTGDQDNQLYMPITAAQRLLGTEDVNSIIVKAAEADQVELVQAQVQRLLRPSFGEEFSVFTQEQTLGIMASLLGTLTVMLAGIAGISLLVGGIGIMNIMLVSVTERTREIGIRKAVGAKTYDIMSQFVIEALLISVIGGAVGMALGWAGAAALQAFVPTQVTAWAVALAFFFSAGIG